MTFTSASIGLCTGKMRSTPTPLEILRTVKVSLTPLPRRAMQTPSNAWMRSFSPSFDANVDAERVTGTERRHVAEPLFLGFDEGMHVGTRRWSPGKSAPGGRPGKLLVETGNCKREPYLAPLALLDRSACYLTPAFARA